jgi:hypothetical protein
VFAAWIMLLGLVVLVPLGTLQTLYGQDRWGLALIPIIISAVFGPGISYTAYLWCLPRMGRPGPRSTATYSRP